jgi:SpoVK/Ycf46/Vps4 family AAA+-type ATPase
MVRRDEPTRAQSPSASINDRPGVGLDDVGGMEDVKREIVESLLIPMANPELRAAYGSTLRNGLLLYGPPGCGKTFLARALAGEMGANFYIVSLADVLDSFLGQSERNIRLLFDTARANPPSVIFFDELDAIGQKRTNLRASPLLRGTVNQLLAEMDGAKDLNDGLFILGASNQPWDIDPALKRPGRFSRTLFVPPPDREARMAILRLHLAGRPVDVVDFNAVVERTTGYSGADLAQVCEIATRRALVESARTGIVHPVKMEDLLASLTEVRSTVNEWFTSAENVVKFANQDGTYDGLAQFMRSRAGRRR